MKPDMSDKRWTMMERWALAIGAPVIAAAIITATGFLWRMSEAQNRMERQLTDIAENAYTRQQAKVDQMRLDRRLQAQKKRLDQHSEKIERLEQVVPREAQGRD